MARLPKMRAKLIEVMDERARDLSNHKAGQQKTLIDQRVKLGELAFGGTFEGLGIIAAGYNDHGTGRNLLPYKHVDLSGYPYGAWYYQGAALSQTALSYVTAVDADAISIDSGALLTWSGWKSFFVPVEGKQLYSYIFSSYAYAAGINDIEMRVRRADTYADALNNTGTISDVVGATTFSASLEDEEMRPAVPFTLPAGNHWLRFEFRARRGSTGAAYFYHPMLERVGEGQSEPSKFTLPLPDRGDFSANLIEGNALISHLQGLECNVGSTGVLTVGRGWAYIPGLARIVQLPDPTEYTGTFTSGALNYIYLTYDLATSTPDIVASTTAPTITPGSLAWFETGNTLRRYIGTVCATSSFIAMPQQVAGAWTQYSDNYTNRTVLSLGSAQVDTTFATAAYIPAHVRSMMVQASLTYGGNGGSAWITYNGSGDSPAAGEGLITMTAGSNTARAKFTFPILCNADRLLKYACNVGLLDFSVWIMGYEDKGRLITS